MSQDKVYYKYYRDNRNRPLVTVAYIEHEGEVFAGHAICSPLDNPSKKIGRAIALQRAQFALWWWEHRKLTNIRPARFCYQRPVIRWEARGVLFDCREHSGTLCYAATHMAAEGFVIDNTGQNFESTSYNVVYRNATGDEVPA